MKDEPILPDEVVVFTDGASRGNPGPAAIGVVIQAKNGEVLHAFGKKLGEQTNNYAEYTALIEALKVCQTAQVQAITVKADSELMIRQLKGIYKVKAPNIIPLYQECQKRLTGFKTVHFVHVRREFNTHADRLANEALDKR